MKKSAENGVGKFYSCAEKSFTTEITENTEKGGKGVFLGFQHELFDCYLVSLVRMSWVPMVLKISLPPSHWKVKRYFMVTDPSHRLPVPCIRFNLREGWDMSFTGGLEFWRKLVLLKFFINLGFCFLPFPGPVPALGWVYEFPWFQDDVVLLHIHLDVITGVNAKRDHDLFGKADLPLGADFHYCRHNLLLKHINKSNKDVVSYQVEKANIISTGPAGPGPRVLLVDIKFVVWQPRYVVAVLKRYFSK